MEQAVKPNVRVTLAMGQQPSTRLVGGREVLQGRLALPSGGLAWRRGAGWALAGDLAGVVGSASSGGALRDHAVCCAPAACDSAWSLMAAKPLHCSPPMPQSSPNLSASQLQSGQSAGACILPTHRAEPREVGGAYWGYVTRLAHSLQDVLEGCPFAGRFAHAALCTGSACLDSAEDALEVQAQWLGAAAVSCRPSAQAISSRTLTLRATAPGALLPRSQAAAMT